jgi:hypothetical protein
MSFMPPQTNGGPPDVAPPGDQVDPPEDVNEVVDACLRAIKAAAEDAGTAHDPEASKGFGAAAFYFAQSVEKLLPQKPSPDAQLKVESDTVKTAAQQAHDEAMQERQHAHDRQMKQADSQMAEKAQSTARRPDRPA